MWIVGDGDHVHEAFFKDGKDDAARSPHGDRGWGLFWLRGGLGLLVALYFNVTPSKALHALVPSATGLHYLIYCFVAGKKAARASAATRQDKNQ